MEGLGLDASVVARYNTNVERIHYTMREGRSRDRKVIRRIITSRRLNPFGINWRRFLVAVDPRGRIVGIGQLKSHRHGSVELASIAVLRRYERKGVAREIIETLIRRSGEGLWLSCLRKMREFYHQFGFYEVPAKYTAPSYYRMIAKVSSIATLFGGVNQQVIVMRISPAAVDR